MPSARDIKRRIKSIKNTRQITKAMQMVAASKMRRAQIRVTDARPYSDKVREVLSHLSERYPEFRHPFLVPREVQKIGVILVTTDKGLCGALNSNLLRMTVRFAKDEKAPAAWVTIGRRGRDFMKRIGAEIVAEITGMVDKPDLLDVVPAAKVMMDEYLKGKVDRVFVAYNAFVNTMIQKPVLQQIIPCPMPPGVEERKHGWDYLYEPSSEGVLSALLPRYVEALVYHAVLENIASEHSARMIAMKNATDNAKEIISDLNLSYNKARQAAITKEMCEIAAGSAAVGK